ncbi:MAG: GtrA family protein [Nitrospira sp. CG24A]|nr:MAG: GtrA family protein [Nitrospira sp. CG24A]
MKRPPPAASRLRQIRVALSDNWSAYRFLRFLLVGLSNALISFIVYLAMLAFLPQTVGMASLAQAIAYGTGMFWSYAWNRTWVFGSRDRVIEEGSRFLVVQVSLMLISIAVIGVAADGLGIDPVLAWVMVMAVITILNFLLLRWWAFASPCRQ